MTVRHLALELYHWMKRLEELGKAMAELAPEALEKRISLEAELMEARQSVEHYHKLLAAQKEETKI
ncbi:MAG: hypothetical protein NTW80_11915 [Deltaproteobacteria bacterium]|nr:hypothetical protein [Deltaproteobacteria bacterium]